MAPKPSGYDSSATQSGSQHITDLDAPGSASNGLLFKHFNMGSVVVFWMTSVVSCLAMSLPAKDEVALGLAIAAPIIDPRPVPGDSPAVFVGDPKDDLLIIDSLDLIPNPPVDDEDFTVLLEGHLTTSIDAHASFKLTAFLNGTVGPSLEENLYDGADILEVWQHGKRARDSLVKGPVQMSYTNFIPYPWMDKGYYKVQTGMWAGDGTRMTAFEGTIWIQGENEGSGWDKSDAKKEL
ncbi:MAG: Phosphatidylglycerol/phosphatidylinositol transfer protein [Ramalina farinacea]|uniref:Phosphatidylglycerol/phosphatidylinositol transfer protein n=1 Tax=Ramalina farinacea TaxID=258253 RepID=A0AA43QYL4_9LECA|nr:Phosphatidylglycerol/phosphatidylinositol transfer protein [Ramalina farinacea]